MYTEKFFKQRIGLVLNSVPGYSETFFKNKIKGLQENGHKVTLFVDSHRGVNGYSECDVVVGPDFSKRNINTLICLLKIVLQVIFVNPRLSLKLYLLNKKDGIGFKDLLKSQHFLSTKLDWLHFGFGTLAKDRENIAKALGARMGVSFRGYDLYLSPLKHPSCFDTLFSKQVKYHVLAEEMKSTLINYGINSNNIQVITPAINVDFFADDTLNTIVGSQTIELTTVARLHWKKGLEYTLEALALLKMNSLNFHYTIIGDGSEYERLVFAAEDLGIRDHVSFLGKVSHKNVKKQLQKTDIYIQYSIQEGFCNSVLEAQAMGLLCVVSNAEGLPENVLHKQTGWVVPKRNPKLLSNKLIEIIKFPETLKQSIRAKAVERVKKEFNLEKQIEAFLSFYEE